MMLASLSTAGEVIGFECSLPWVARLMEEAAGPELRSREPLPPTIVVRVEATGEPFHVGSWEPLTRGAWRRDGEVVVEDVLTAGFDLHVRCSPARPKFTFRWRPPPKSHAAGWLLRSRFHLLARAALFQFPALWWAGVRGRAPLHAVACTAGSSTPLLAGPGGVGKSTLLAAELTRGGKATSDNLCVGDGETVWGLVEPMRIEGGTGRRMPHARREISLPHRVEALTPDRVVVVRRGAGSRAIGRPCAADAAVRSLVTGTYMAGELRRYWGLAATLASGLRVGPSHPAVAEVAGAFGERLPCYELILPPEPGTRLADALDAVGVGVWT